MNLISLQVNLTKSGTAGIISLANSRDRTHEVIPPSSPTRSSLFCTCLRCRNPVVHAFKIKPGCNLYVKSIHLSALLLVLSDLQVDVSNETLSSIVKCANYTKCGEATALLQLLSLLLQSRHQSTRLGRAWHFPLSNKFKPTGFLLSPVSHHLCFPSKKPITLPQINYNETYTSRF